MIYRYLYKITNKINGKIYIGIRKTPRKTDNGYMGSGLAVKKAIKKYGRENFLKEILFYFKTDEEMFAKEKEIVNEVFVSNPETYNLIMGGRGAPAGENHPLFGKKRPKHSDYMKKNNPTKGVSRPQSVKDAISKANKGKKHSFEVNSKKGLKGEKNPMFGKIGTATGKTWINNGIESRLVNLSQYYLDESWKIGRISTSTKAVLQIDKQTKEILKEFSSLKEAGIKTQTSQYSISSCCRGKLKTAGGFIWKFKNGDN
jgi:group I intron endonuclease